MQSDSSSARLILSPPLIQPPLVNYLPIVFYPSEPVSTFKKLVWKRGGLVIKDDLKAQQPGKMWAGAGVVQPSVTPDADNQQVPCGRPGSAGCRPLVAVLLLLFIYRSSQMR